MDGTFKFATQLVVLLTALTGLYQVTKAGSSGTESGSHTKSSGKDGPFDFFFSMLYLEVNIDPASARWTELDWDLTQYRRAYADVA
jgi:hypothetical protein